LKFSSGQSIGMTGFERILDTVAVQAGWNLIGSVSQSLVVTTLQSIPPGLVTSDFFRYDTGGYSVSDSILPGHGYWVKVNQNGSLVLGPGAEMAGWIRIQPTADTPPPPPEVDISSGNMLPAKFTLEQNHPNPFNPRTDIRFGISPASPEGPEGRGWVELGFVSLKIHDVLGRKVATLVNETKEPGEYTVMWDATGLPSGVYLYRLEVSSGLGRIYTSTRKAVYVR
jgi:hypothetical protein